MGELAIATDLNDYHLDILGQQPLLKIYTQLCLCYSVDDASSHAAIIDKLNTGLERLSASFPWVAGQVVAEGASEGNSGIVKIKPLEKVPRLVVKDLRHDPSIPTMFDLKRANFPMSMLDENNICPRTTLPIGSDESAPEPVFLIQANFIMGGLLLSFVAHHNTMDITGQHQIMHLLSKACHGEPFTSEEVSSGNLDRSNLIPLLDGSSYKQGSWFTRQIQQPNPTQSATTGPDGLPEGAPVPPKCTWTYFTFSNSSLTALKSLGTATVPSGYISTDDALCVFIWQSVTRARLARLNLNLESTFARAIDTRRYLNIPATYPGLIQNMTYHTFPLSTLVSSPLGVVAWHLRTAVDPKTSTLNHDTRALATYLTHTPDKSVVAFTASLELSHDIMLSSWSKIDSYTLDFDLGLGRPQAVRRPRFVPVESLIYFMPRRPPDGDLAVAICLRDQDLQRLREDGEFARFATEIG